MGLYPNKKQGTGFGFDTQKLKDLDGTGAGAAGLALGEGISNIGKKNIGYGVSHKGVGASTAGSAIKTAGIGMEIGSKFGGFGGVIGAGAGLVAGTAIGLINAKKDKIEAYGEFRQRQGEAITDASRTSKKKYGTLQGYTGTALYKRGGKVDGAETLGSKGNLSVILGGKLHKDGGNDIVKASNKEKIAETEREELLLSFEHTKRIEKIIEKFDKNNLEANMIELGREIKKILLNETIDNSGLYS